jgi:hypothetical protein
MKARLMAAVVIMAMVVALSGCKSAQPTTGFLSDYSKLQKENDSVMRYVDEAAVGQYTSFIVDPVQVKFYKGAESAGKLTDKQLTDLKNYTYEQIVQAIRGAGKTVAYQAGPNVGKIRVALTEIDKTSAVNIVPQASLLGVGIGGASMEAEVVDSVTGKQIGAVVESGKGGRIPFTNLGDLTAAKKVIEGWAKEFQKRLEKAK